MENIMDKPKDWADEIARDWDPALAIAAALRKAKAEGFMQAASYILPPNFSKETANPNERVYFDHFKAIADNIEKGEI